MHYMKSVKLLNMAEQQQRNSNKNIT